MECLMPDTLVAIREIRWAIESNSSVRDSVKAYILKNTCNVAHILREHLIRQQTGTTPSSKTEKKQPIYQAALLSLVERGYQGQPILAELKNLESEVYRAAMIELDEHISRLPFLAMIPLFFFQFPAFLILLIGPLLSQLLSQVGVS